METDDSEFRAGAVRIVEETGKPVAHVARELGTNEYTLPGVPLPLDPDGPTRSSARPHRDRAHGSR